MSSRAFAITFFAGSMQGLIAATANHAGLSWPMSAAISIGTFIGISMLTFWILNNFLNRRRR
jgi:hypothetical protein